MLYLVLSSLLGPVDNHAYPKHTANQHTGIFSWSRGNQVELWVKGQGNSPAVCTWQPRPYRRGQHIRLCCRRQHSRVCFLIVQSRVRNIWFTALFLLNCIGGSRGGTCPAQRPPRVQIILFRHTNFSKHNRLGSPRPPTRSTPPTGNPGSATELI